MKREIPKHVSRRRKHERAAYFSSCDLRVQRERDRELLDQTAIISHALHADMPIRTAYRRR